VCNEKNAIVDVLLQGRARKQNWRKDHAIEANGQYRTQDFKKEKMFSFTNRESLVGSSSINQEMISI
jgi:hypothetical protein